MMKPLEALGLGDVEAVDSVEGGARLLLNATGWASSQAWDGRWVLGVCVDTAEVPLGTTVPAAAGAVAVLIGPAAPVRGQMPATPHFRVADRPTDRQPVSTTLRQRIQRLDALALEPLEANVDECDDECDDEWESPSDCEGPTPAEWKRLMSTAVHLAG